MTGNIFQLKPNSRTAARLRIARQQARDRLIRRIGINPEDAPLFDEELRFLVWCEQQTRFID